MEGHRIEENSIGQFIAELRKEKSMTQKDLADQLHITDKAVSKWERGLSYPDISLLTPLANILGITTGELLSGQKNDLTAKDLEESIDHALVYAEKSTATKIISFRNILTTSFSALLLLGMIVCAICDVAISGTFTWSKYPISSILFAWFVFVPVIKYGCKGILGSLTAASVLILPFLYVISRIVGGNNLIMAIGIRIALISIVYLWCVYLFFMKFTSRKILAAAFSLLLLVPLHLIINISLARILSISVLDVWDMLSFGMIIISSLTCFLIDHRRQK